MNGYIFRCSESTYYECLKRGLFGQTPFFKDIVSKIKTGDTLFLYNATTKRLEGEFVATSDGQENIEADAWKGKFPWQVRVSRIQEFKPLPKREVEDLIVFDRNHLPKIPLTTEQIESLRELFKNAKHLPSSEVEFLDKFPKDFRTKDGHRVASQGEQAIDNWLFDNKIVHSYEPKLPVEENVFSDFSVTTKDNQTIYIEYWGLDNAKYLKREESKIQIYNENNLTLIEIFSDDIRALDEVLYRKLRSFKF